MKEPTYKDLMWQDTQQYIRELSSQKNCNRQALIEMAQAHRLICREEASSHLGDQ